MKRTVKLRVFVRDDRVVYIVADEGQIQRVVALARPEDIDYIRGDTSYSKTITGVFTYDDGAKPRARRKR